MIVLRSAEELRAWTHDRGAGVIGFVPTMGALHQGHLSLVRRARDLSDLVVLSIFVNPLQFGPSEDLDSYPRNERRDLDLAESEKVDAAFIPPVEEMYPEGASTRVMVGPVGRSHEGAFRPGHFDGVATVVAKLFNLVQPHLAFFGQKDAQQVAVIKKMVTDLDIPVEIVACPTQRDPDGLALSSRNVYLSPEERTRALAFPRALAAVADRVRSGEALGEALEHGRRALAEADGVEPDYLDAVDPLTFGTPRADGPVLCVGAVRVGRTRLIDNVVVESLDRPPAAGRDPRRNG